MYHWSSLRLRKPIIFPILNLATNYFPRSKRHSILIERKAPSSNPHFWRITEAPWSLSVGLQLPRGKLFQIEKVKTVYLWKSMWKDVNFWDFLSFSDAVCDWRLGLWPCRCHSQKHFSKIWNKTKLQSSELKFWSDIGWKDKKACRIQRQVLLTRVFSSEDKSWSCESFGETWQV